MASLLVMKMVSLQNLMALNTSASSLFEGDFSLSLAFVFFICHFFWILVFVIVYYKIHFYFWKGKLHFIFFKKK